MAAYRSWAQPPDFSTDVTVVTLFATVRDRQGGRIARNLSRDDFLLQEDGIPQTIRYFSRESDLPLAVGLLVDTSRSQASSLEPERRASYTFLDQVLRDKDQAFVVHFDDKVEVPQGFTSSRKELAAALFQLKIPGEYATLLYDAIRESSENLMKAQQGRKAFILLSDGVDFRSKTSVGTAIEYAQRADTIIYSIRFSDHVRLYRPGTAAVQAITGKHGKDVMQRLAKETGGAAFEVSTDQTIETIYARIEDLLRNQYSLGYTPERTDASKKYRNIKLTTKRTDLTVHTRDGYYPK